jgi:hypothetical protein
MGLLSELTYTHMEVMSAVDEIAGRISEARRRRHGESDLASLLSGLVPWAIGLRSVLLDYFDHQRDQLFPRVRRVFGCDLEEVALLEHYHGSIVEALDAFLRALPDLEDERPMRPIQVAHLELLFEEFRDLYDRHCLVERKFYESYSTILFPGGAVAE